MDVHTVEAMLTFPSAFLIAVFDLDQCSFLFMSAFKRGGLSSVGEVMAMQIYNKGDSLNDNLWAEMSLMTAGVVIVLAILWQFLW